MARNTTPKRGASRQAPKKTQQKNDKLPFFFLGVVVGIGISGLTYLSLKQSDALQEVVQTTDKPTTKQQDTGNSPYFDFYAVLPDMEVVVPKEEMPVSKQSSQKSTPPKPSKIENAKPVQTTSSTREDDKKPTAQVGEFLLQAGSFSRNSDAERRRAELGFQGFNARIQPVELDSGATTHRVMVGPYNNMDNMHQAKEKLAQAGIDTLAIRVRK